MTAGPHSWPDGLTLRHDLRPGDLGRVIALHGEVYSQWSGFGVEFEAFVARTIAEYGLENEFNGRIWLLERGACEDERELVGCCAIAFRSEGLAQLRWVLLHPQLRGGGLGRGLVETALDYCRESGVERVYLETTDGLDASSALYRKFGFQEVSNEVVPMWREPRPLIRMERRLK
ncbi:MAG: GNAT family N-acetyltransferase [Wenzhouxiangellaceae bacterium]